MASQPGTPNIHRMWRREQPDDEKMSSAGSVESLLDEESDTGKRPVAGKKKSSKRRFTGTVCSLHSVCQVTFFFLNSYVFEDVERIHHHHPLFFIVISSSSPTGE